jgi:DeoR/GlpR family transcriptional regulator of sugar metabolism
MIADVTNGDGRGRRKMLRSDRLRRIVQETERRGSVTVGELAELLGVTPMTVRRDLAALEAGGRLKREHRGAVALQGFESEYGRRAQENHAAKRDIGQRAAELVQDGATIIIDSGSTMAEFARALQGKRGLTIITNSVTTATIVAELTDATVVVTGGVLRRSTLGVAGDLTVQALAGLRADAAFIATSGLHPDGISYPALEEVPAKRAMIAAAAYVVLLTDHTKFDCVRLARIASLDSLDCIVTSRPPQGSLADAIEQAGVRLIVTSEDDVPGRRAE